MSMKWVRALSRTFSAIMVTSLLVLSMAAPMVSAAPGDNEVWVQAVELQDGASTVTVELRDFDDLAGCNFWLYVDPDWAYIESCTAGNFPGVTTLAIVRDVPSSSGLDAVSCILDDTVNHDGNFVMFTAVLKPVETHSAVTFPYTGIGWGNPPSFRDKDSVALTVDYTNITTYEVLAPTEVWVDDSFTGPTDDGGHTWGYNAFATIQGGIDAVSASTVHVAAGNYGAFKVDNKNDVNVLGAGPTNTVINTFTNPSTGAQTAMAYVNNSDNVVLDGIGFEWTTPPVTASNSAIHYQYCDACEVNNVTIDGIMIAGNAGDGYGIQLGSSPASNVSITRTTITNCNVGVYVHSGSEATIRNCTITGVSSGSPTLASYCSTGVYVSEGKAVITGSTIQDCSRGAYSYPTAPSAGDIPSNRKGCGVYVDCDTGNLVTIGGDGCASSCSILNNDWGICSVYGDRLTCNHCSIVDNREYGVYVGYPPAAHCEYNWWGAADGPSHSPGLGDPVSSNVDYTPWLDGPCPGGDPIGIDAKFRAAGGGKPGDAVKFTDISTPPPGCTIDRWEWDLDGDGTIDSTQPNPTFVYYRAGSYIVTLTVYSDHCNLQTFRDSYTLTITIVKEADKDRVEDAKMSVAYLNIDPMQVLPNQEVIVSANVCNQGGERGTKTVALMVNGTAQQSQTVSVSPGACQQVTFRTSQPIPGTYQVAVDGMVGQFSVLGTKTVTKNVPTEQETGIGTAGIIAIVVVIIVLIVGLVVIFKKE